MRFDTVAFLESLFQAPMEQDELAVGPFDLAGLSPDWRDHYGERVAIMMEDGLQSREHAEATALRDTIIAMRRDAELACDPYLL